MSIRFLKLHQCGSAYGYAWCDLGNRCCLTVLEMLQCDVSGPAGLTPLHLAALLRDQGACARCLLSTDARMRRAWFSSCTSDGKTPADFARQAACSNPSSANMIFEQAEDPGSEATAEALHMNKSEKQSDLQHPPESVRFPQHAAKKQCLQQGRSHAPQQVRRAAADEGSSALAQHSHQHSQSWLAQAPSTELKEVPDSSESFTLGRAAPMQTPRPPGNASWPMHPNPAEVEGNAWASLQPSWASLGEYHSKPWQLSSNDEAYDAVNSEDESLAATHVEMMCSDSELSPPHSSWKD